MSTDKELTYYPEAKAYRVLRESLERLMHHAGADRKVNVSGIKRALAKANTIERGEIKL